MVKITWIRATSIPRDSQAASRREQVQTGVGLVVGGPDGVEREMRRGGNNGSILKINVDGSICVVRLRNMKAEGLKQEFQEEATRLDEAPAAAAAAAAANTTSTAGSSASSSLSISTSTSSCSSKLNSSSTSATPAAPTTSIATAAPVSCATMATQQTSATLMVTATAATPSSQSNSASLSVSSSRSNLVTPRSKEPATPLISKRKSCEQAKRKE
uniref:Uncharacterized protein n=1 Tax=Caenorhabditis japonica TaxID=281687 RepID=A0A8R1I2E5_CAEJA